MELRAGDGAPRKVLILPRGMVRTEKGDFLVDDEAMSLMVKGFKERGIDMVVDYEHQTLTGLRAPAAGWIKELIPGPDGLWARVEWTEPAARMIAAREYRYLSPVVLVRESDGRAVSVSSVALTNAPAIHGMRPMVNSQSINNPLEDKDMAQLREGLIQALGLGQDADDARIVDEVSGLVAGARAFESIREALAEALGIQEDASPDEVAALVVQAVRERPGQEAGGGGGQEKETALAARVTELEAALRERDARDMVEKALKEGRLAPSLKDWGMELALKDPAAFQAFCEKQTPLTQRVLSHGGPDDGMAEIRLGKEIAKALGG